MNFFKGNFFLRRKVFFEENFFRVTFFRGIFFQEIFFFTNKCRRIFFKDIFCSKIFFLGNKIETTCKNFPLRYILCTANVRAILTCFFTTVYDHLICTKTRVSSNCKSKKFKEVFKTSSMSFISVIIKYVDFKHVLETYH